MKFGIRIIAAISALFLPFLTLLVVVANAQTVEEPSADYSACSPLDVVFLIDQSTSMSVGGNDPTEQRKYAVESAIDLMSDIALDSCPGVIHRVAVISYGTNAEIDLSLSEIGPFSPARPDEAFDRRTELKRNIRADELGQTDPKDAFSEAKSILDSAAPLDSGDLVRKRAIVFITDGIPCVNDERGECGPNYPAGAYMVDLQNQLRDDFEFDNLALEREQCLRELREAQIDIDAPLPFEERQECLTEFPARPENYENSTFIWVLLMRDADRAYPQSVYGIWENIARNYGADIIDLSNNRQAIPTSFRAILEQMTGVRAARLECGNFAVNPYLQKVVFNFNKFEPSVKVSLSYVDVNGQEYVLEDNQSDGGFQVTEHLVSGPNERYEIVFPYPGFWSISSEDCSNLDAFYQPIEASPRSVLIPPVIPQYDLLPNYNPDFPVYLEFEFIDQVTGNIVPEAEHPHFALEVTAEVAGPGGSKTFELEKLPNEERYRASEPLEVNVDGEYTVDYTVRTKWHEGEPNIVSTDYSTVFDQDRVILEQSTSYQVRPVTPFQLQIVEPEDGQHYKPVHIAPGLDQPPSIAPLPVRLRLVNRDGGLFEQWADALPNPDETFVAEIPVAGGAISTTLVSDPASPGEFIGTFEGVDQTGEHTVTARLTDIYSPELLNEDYFPDNPVTSIDFTRGDETWRLGFVVPQEGEDLRPIHDTLWEDGLHWPLRVAPIPLRVELLDENGQPYTDAASVMQYAPQVISATHTVDGQQTSTHLEPDPEAPGQYYGEIITNGDPGEQVAVADLGLNFDGYTPDSIPAEVTFTRADSLLTSPTTYVAMLWLLVALLALWVIRMFAVRRNPVTGELRFAHGGDEIVTFNLSSGKNFRTIKGKEISQYPALNLDWVKVRSVKQRRARTPESDMYLGGFEFEGPPVQIEYKPADGRVQRTELPPRQPTSVGDSIVDMEYIPLVSGDTETS